MTGHDHDPEDLLRDAFRDRVDDTEYAATPMTDVVSAARAIRRRRRTTALLATAAAVVIVTVPTAVILGNNTGDSPPAPTSTQLPSNTPDKIASPTNAPSQSSWLSNLETGPPPGIDYVEGNVYVSTTGARTPVSDDHGISAITPYHGGFLVADTRNHEGTVGLHQIDAQGADNSLGCTSGAPVISSDQLLTAWVSYACAQAEGSVTGVVIYRGIASGMGEGETSQRIDGSASLVGMIDDEVVYTAMFGEGAWITDLKNEPREIPGLTSVGGVDRAHGLVSGQTGGSEGDTGVIADAETGEVQTTIDGWQLGAFSPDGRYVEATQTRLSTPPVAIFDTTTGELVAEMFGGGAVSPNPGNVAWEDDTHLLVTVDDNRNEAIVRADLEGHLSLATAPRPHGEAPTYVFAARP